MLGDLRARAGALEAVDGAAALVIVPDEGWASFARFQAGLGTFGPFVCVCGQGEEAVSWIRAAALGGIGICGLFAAGHFTDGVPPVTIVADHLNLTGENPLKGPNIAELGVRFPDMTEPYDPILRRQVGQLGVEGVVAGVPDPFDVRHLSAAAHLGYQMVTQDLVHNTIAARHAGLRVVACVLAMAEGHAEVVRGILGALEDSVAA